MENNNLFCDLETGVCGVADDENIEIFDYNQKGKMVNLYYVTDPICSHCWALEPVLRRFLIQYEKYFNFNVVMGGLLEKWDDKPVDPQNGIFKPAEVADHWREVGKSSRMPIDGSLMIDNPVTSSYPPSRVFKILQKNYDDSLAYKYLRRIREALFVFNQNISNSAVLVDIVNKLNMNGEAVVNESEKLTATELLNEDFELARSLGVRGFPTIIMINNENKGAKIVGARSIDDYVNGLKQSLGLDELKSKSLPSLSKLIKKERLLFSREIEVMYEVDQDSIISFIEKELKHEEYTMNELLGESYITIT